MSDSEITKNALEIKKILENDPIVKEYIRVKLILEHDKFYQSIKKQLCSLEKKGSKDIEKINELNEKLNTYPLYVNFLYLKDEVDSLLNEIKSSFVLK